MDGQPPFLWQFELLRLWIGLLGAVSFAAMRPDPTWRRFGVTVGIGWVISAIGPPWVCELFNWNGVHAANATTFLGGFTGNTLATLLLVMLETVLPDAARAWIQKWLGKDPQSPGPPKSEGDKS